MLSAEEIEQLVLFRDASLLIIDKPAGLPSHKGPKGGETMDDYLDLLRFGMEHRPALGHRLDKDTSGCLALGRHPRAISDLGALFANQKADKTYWAVVCGHLMRDAGTLDLPIGKVSQDKRSWWMKVDEKGQPARTHWQVLGRSEWGDGEAVTAVALTPETGRTHQLRVHMAYMGHPIIGDGIYGGPFARQVDPALHLHARTLSLPFYRQKPAIEAIAPLPMHMRVQFDRCMTGLDV